MHNRATPIGLAAALFLISGFAALVYQVIWQRILGIFSGAHIYSITLIVTAFMAGLGFGSLVGGRVADRLRRRDALAGFAVCELCIGLFALASPWLYYDAAYLKLGFLVRYPLLLPLVHFLLLLVPTFLMGASLPLLARGLVQRLDRAARIIGVLYGVNALGAALGAFVSVWSLIGALGFVSTIGLAALLNGLACAGALVLRARMAEGEPAAATETIAEPTGGAPALGLWTWAAIYATSGFIALSLEVLWFRILDTAIKSSPYTFGHLLGTFLLFLALGSLVGAVTVRRSRRPDLTFLWGQWGIALSAAGALVLLARLPADGPLLSGLYHYWSSDSGIEMKTIAAAWAARGSGAEHGEVLRRTLQIYVLLPLGLIALPTFLMGWTYAYVQRTVQTDSSVVGWRVGVIQTANIAGSMLGCALTGAALLTLLGTPATLRLLVLLASVFGVLAVLRGGAPRWAAAAVIGVAVLVAAALPGHRAFWARLHGSTPADVVVGEDASSVVAMQRQPAGGAVLRVSGTGMSLWPYGGHWTVLGLVPALAHPRAEEILLIGLGAGNTAWAVAAVPEVSRIDLYEIAKPEIDVLVGAQREWFGDPAIESLLDDPRVRMIFSDGRLAMRLSDTRYDLIEADALEPYMAYSGNLYSREFFDLVRRSLKPGGWLCTYTPTERVRRTVVDVFPHVLSIDSASAHFMIAGDTPIEFSTEAIRRRFGRPEVQAYLERSGLAERTAADIDLFLRSARIVVVRPGDRGPWATGDVNTDLFPRDEYAKHHER